MRLPLPLLLLALLSGCMGALRPAPADPLAARFDPVAFFTGRTEGKGTLRKIMSGSTPLRVEGVGRVAPDGALILDQRVHEGAAAPQSRQWRIREIAPGRYAGSLTDAVGPMVGAMEGNRLHIRFTMKGGLDVEQWLTLQPGGRTLANRMTVRKFGMVVAALDETIRKAD
jgi:hypothetical protein